MHLVKKRPRETIFNFLSIEIKPLKLKTRVQDLVTKNQIS